MDLISTLDEIRSLLKTTGRSDLMRNALSLFGSRSGSFVLGAISLILYGALFEKSAIATVALFEMVVALFLTLGFRWSSIGLIRFGKEEHLRAGSIRETSSARLGVTLPILALCLGSIFVFREHLLEYVGTEDRSIVAFLVIDLLLFVARDHLVALYSAAERHSVNAAIYLGLSIGKLVVLGIFWIGWMDADAETYIKLVVAVDAALLLLHVAFLRKEYFWPIRLPQRTEFTRLIRFVLPQVYGFAALYGINWVDTYVIRLYLTADDLGGYQFTYSIFMRIASPAFIVSTLFFPRIISWNQSSPETTERFARLAPACFLGGTGVLALIGIACAAPVLTLVFGDKYQDAYSSFYLLLAALPFFFLTYTYVPLLNARDRVAIVQASNGVAAAVNVAIDLAFVPRYGIVAAALGTFVAIQLRSILLMLATHRMLGLPTARLLVPSLLGTLAVIVYFVGQGSGN